MQSELGRLQRLIILNCLALCAKQKEGVIAHATQQFCFVSGVNNHEEEQKPQSWLQLTIGTILFFVILSGFPYLSF